MIDFYEFFQRLYELLQYEEVRKGAFVVLPATVFLGFWFGRYFPAYPQPTPAPPAPQPDARVPEFETKIEHLQARIVDLQHQLTIAPENVERARRAVAATGPGLWLAVSPAAPANYNEIRSSIPIYTVANLKGGVGKTTIAAGLAAYYANPHMDPERACKRVLMIDLDFQGSLSSMALTTAQRIPQHEHVSRAAG